MNIPVNTPNTDEPLGMRNVVTTIVRKGGGVDVGVEPDTGLAQALSPTKLMRKMQIIPRKGSV